MERFQGDLERNQGYLERNRGIMEKTKAPRKGSGARRKKISTAEFFQGGRIPGNPWYTGLCGWDPFLIQAEPGNIQEEFRTLISLGLRPGASVLEKSGKDRVDKGCCRRRKYWILAQEVPGAGKDAEGKVLDG